MALTPAEKDEVDRIANMLIDYGLKKNNDLPNGMEYDLMGCRLTIICSEDNRIRVMAAPYQTYQPICRYFKSRDFSEADAETLFSTIYEYLLKEELLIRI